jgi:hypothetical protein
MNPCGYLSARALPLMAERLPGAVPSWWATYGPALVAVLLVLGVILAFDLWAQLTGRMTLSNMLRRGPAWLKALVGGGLIWLWVHLLVQGGGTWARLIKRFARSGLPKPSVRTVTPGTFRAPLRRSK